jgi:type I restriction enzyme S subunit
MQVQNLNYKKTRLGEIPEEWRIELLKNILSDNLKNGLTKNVSTYGSGYPIVEINSLYGSDFYLKYTNLRNVPLNDREVNMYSLKNNDFIINRVSKLKEGAGKLALVKNPPENLVIEGNLIRIRIDQRMLFPEFFEYYSKSTAYRQYMQANCKTVALTSINQDIILNTPIILPSLKEQQKIASILSNVDNLIQKTDQVIEQTQRLKKGLMQRLLTKGIGHTKFKQTGLGEIPESWNVGEIQQYSKITTGAKNTQDRVEGGMYPFFVRSQKIERINTYSYDGEAVLTAGDGVGTGKVFHYINGKFDFHQRVYKMSNFSEHLDGYFFYLYFSNYFLRRVESLSAKASVDSVRMDMIAKMLIPIPPIREQQKITSVLSNIDKLVLKLQDKKKSEVTLKKGLMQQLLTGKVRVKV